MTGEQLWTLLDKQSEEYLRQVKIMVQRGDGESQEVVGVRLVTELGEGEDAASDQIVLRVRPSVRTNGREEIGKEKIRAEKRKPVLKEAEAALAAG